MDPRLAKGIIEAVDTRFEQLARRQPRTSYGTVASVDEASRTCSVYVSGDAVPSLGFSYSALKPSVGDRVRVVIDPRGDRYVEATSGTDIARADRLRLDSVSDVKLDSADHAFQIGPDNGSNLAMDGNEILSRNNGAAADLHINADGGQVTIGNNLTGAGLGLRIREGGLAVGTADQPPTAESILVGKDDTRLFRFEAASLGITGGVLPFLASNTFDGNVPATSYPHGISIMPIGDNTLPGWPTSDGRGIVMTINPDYSPVCVQFWSRHGAVGSTGSTSSKGSLWYRAWANNSGSWLSWLPVVNY